MVLFVRSPFGASLRGTRDQARRMTALGYNVWLIRFMAFVFSGFWTGVAGLLFVYYNQFISPQVAALTTSAEALLMVISGGTATLLGPIAGAAIVVIMKNVVSAYIERWNLVLGVICVAIITFMPEETVRFGAAMALGLGDGTRQTAGAGTNAGARPMTALSVNALTKSFGGLRVTKADKYRGRPGRAPLDHRAERRRQNDAVQPDHRRDEVRQRLDRAVRQRHYPRPQRAHARISEWHAPTRSSRCFRAILSCAT